jgi:hypothetical protein
MRPRDGFVALALVLTAVIAWKFVLDAGGTAAVATMPKPGAGVSRIMTDSIAPASTVVFKAVSTTVTAAGTEERSPKTPEEWHDLGSNAHILAEAARLLLSNARHKDEPEWIGSSQALAISAAAAEAAASARQPDGVFDAAAAIYAACERCHQKYPMSPLLP